MTDVEMFENDLDPCRMRVSGLGRVKDTFLAMRDAAANPRKSYEKAYNEFEKAYQFLSEVDKQEFITWKYENGYE